MSGEVLVPTHRFHLGGDNNRDIHPWITHHPHEGKTITWCMLKWLQISGQFYAVEPTMWCSSAFSSSMRYQAASPLTSSCSSSLRSWWVRRVVNIFVTQSRASEEQMNRNVLRLSRSTRGCISCHPCCWCVWACRWSIAPSWRRFWGSCSSTSTTVGLTSSSWSAPCPASSSFISPTSSHQRNK